MTESDEWATVETVVDEDMESNPDGTTYRQGPSGIEQGILEKSRLICMVSDKSSKLHWLKKFFFSVLFILSNTNPWLLLFIVVGVYYLIQKLRFSSQITSSDAYSTLSKTFTFHG